MSKQKKDEQPQASNNETALRDALVALRRVGSRSRDDNGGKVRQILDSIEVEMDRIQNSTL